jgi:hypothetical protein
MFRLALLVSMLTGLAPATGANAQDAKTQAMQQAVRAAFTECAAAYRQSITGKHQADHPFGCVTRAARATNPDNTYAIETAFGAANRAGAEYIKSLDEEAAAAFTDRDHRHAAAMALPSVASAAAAYRASACTLWFDAFLGGTGAAPAGLTCHARLLDQEIGNLLLLLKTYDVIDNGH